MSKEAARAFHERLKTDNTLAQKVVDRGTKISDEDMVKIAGEAGFACTVDDLDNVGMEIASELGDKDLDAVVGGSGPTGVNALKVKPGVQNFAVSAAKMVSAGTKS